MATTKTLNMPIGSIVPLMIPPNYSDWYTLAGIAPRFPRVDIKVIVDPKITYNTGPADPTYQAGIGMLKNAGVGVLGLLQPSFTPEINTWILQAYKEFYPNIDGIAFNAGSSMFTDYDAYGSFNLQTMDAIRLARKEFDNIVLIVNLQPEEELFEDGMRGAERFLREVGPDNIDTVLFFLLPGKSDDGISVESIGTRFGKDWMKQFPTDKFGVVIWPKEQLRLNEFRNQIYAIYANGIARYVYIKDPDDVVDRNLSPYFESTALELDRLAESEGKQRPPGWKMTGYDMTPNTVGVGGGANHPGGADGTTKKDISPGWREEYDYMGVKKLYPDYDSHAFLSSRARDGDKSPFWTKSNTINHELDREVEEGIEYTIYIKKTGPKKENLKPHDSIYHCGIVVDDEKFPESGYFIRINNDGQTQMQKLVNGVYTQQRVASGTNHSFSEWLGFKFVFYRFYPPDFIDDVNERHVRLELWMDENCTTQDGQLHIANKWRLVQETTDTGNWIFPKGTKKIPKNGYRVLNDKIKYTRFDFNRKIKRETECASIRAIKVPRAD